MGDRLKPCGRTSPPSLLSRGPNLVLPLCQPVALIIDLPGLPYLVFLIAGNTVFLTSSLFFGGSHNSNASADRGSWSRGTNKHIHLSVCQMECWMLGCTSAKNEVKRDLYITVNREIKSLS